MLSLQRSAGNRAVRQALDDASPGRELVPGVRIHADANAARLAAGLAAQAFTRGRDIYFAAGQYAPETDAGQRLLRHELGHVVQQARGDVSAFAGTVVPSDHASEARAGADAGLTAAISAGLQAAVIQRQPASPAAVTIQFDQQRPWLYTAQGAEVDVSMQLYGSDLTEVVQTFQDEWWLGNGVFSVVVPEALREPYREQFRTAMRGQLGRDADRLEEILLNGAPAVVRDQGDEVVGIVRRWSQARDVRLEDGRSYFDAFLGRLRVDTWYRDYLVTTGASHTYFDTLLSDTGFRVGEISALITQNSREYGGYRPTWQLFDPTGGPRKELPTRVDPAVVKRTADLVIEHLEGLTGEGESRVVADILTGLPGPELAAVLQELMARYSDHGEAWDVGMLYWLFEDMWALDRAVVATDMKRKGVMDPHTVDALVAGRAWGGKYLPWTTRKGEEAAMWWADVANKSSGPKKWGASVEGGFASLWTPHTAGTTVLTLATPGVGKFVGGIPLAGEILTVAGTGVGAFQVTIELQELITGKNVWTGSPLGEGEKIANVLLIVSNTILLGVGFASAVKPPAVEPPAGGALQTTPPVAGELPPTGGAATPNMRWYVTRSADGTWTAHGENLETGEQAVARVDGATGDGVVVNLTTGAVASVSGFRVQALGGLLEGGESVAGAAAAGEAEVEVGEWLSLPAEETAATAVPVEPAVPTPPVIPRMLPGGGPTLGSFLSNDSLRRIETAYGISVRRATEAASTWAEVDTIARSLGGLGSQYRGLVGELASADASMYAGYYSGAQHTSSNQPGPDVPTVSATGAPRIVIRESKLGTGRSAYRVGESGLPSVYRQGETAVREYIWSIIKNTSLPTAVRARFKMALDEGAIEWQLDTYGNVRVKLSGTDQFPGDIDIATPIVLPRR